MAERFHTYNSFAQAWRAGEYAAGRAHAYTPTLGMVRELARIETGEGEVEPLERDRCERRGLVDRFGALTSEGQRVLARQLANFHRTEEAARG